MGTHTTELRGLHSSTQADQMPFLGGLPLCNHLRFNCYRASNFDTGEQTQARWLYSSCTAVDPIAERRIEVRFGCSDSTSANMAAPRIGLESERSFQLINVKDIQRASDVGPNITGSASFQNNVGLTNEKGIMTGAFTAGSEFPDTFSRVTGYGTSALGFDASLADSKYGSSESIQPSSLKLLPCIRS